MKYCAGSELALGYYFHPNVLLCYVKFHQWWWIIFAEWLTNVRRWSLICSRDHYRRFSPSQISDTPRPVFEPAQNGSGFVEWSCAVVITTTPHNLLYICSSFDKFYLRTTYFCLLMEKSGVFFAIHFVDILNLFLVNSWDFRVRFLDLFSFLIKMFISIKMKGFCSSNKLSGILYESAKSFVELMKPFTIILMNRSVYCICSNVLVLLLSFSTPLSCKYH